MERSSQPQPDYERSTEAVLTRSDVEDLRARQKAQYDARYDAENGIDDDQALYDEMNASVDEYLADNGIDEDHPYYLSLRKSVRGMSYDRISNQRWNYGDWDDPSSPDRKLVPGSRGIDHLHRMQTILLGRELDETTASAEAEEAARQERDVLRSQVESAREAWAAMTAKRAGRLFGKRKEQHDKLEASYFDLVNRLGRAELNDQLEDDSVTDDEKNLAVVSYLFDEQAKLRELTKDKLNSTVIGRVGTFMNKGSKKERFAKRFGAGLVVAGLGGFALAGAVGTGVLTVATIAAAKFGKGYILNDDKRDIRTIDSVTDEAAVAEAMADEQAVLGDEREDLFDSANRHFSYLLEDDMKLQQKERKKAFGKGALTVAAGSTVGYGIGFVGSQVSQIFDGPDFQLKHPLGHHDVIGYGASPESVDRPNVVQDTRPDTTVTPDAKPELNWGDFSSDARTVKAGEGWYQTFSELGIPQQNWQHVLETAGPKLHEQGLAYFDQSANEWRISKQGELPQSALRVIARASKRDGFDLAA